MSDDSNLIKFNTQDEINRLIADLSAAQKELSLVCVIGAGVSISQGYPDWNHYVLQLIDYWRFHLQNLVDRDDTDATDVKREDIVFLEWLREAKYTNKRKVDLVNYIVEQYSEAASHDKSDTTKIYLQVVNECERFIFLKLQPIQSRNEVLEQLVRMHTTFVTTNYDQQIEESIKRQLAQNPVRYADITEVPDSFHIDSIIHVHGMPLVNKMFVSSSTSYSQLYLENTKLREKFQAFFSNKQKIVFLFIGCSMEEEEVLSLLKIPDAKLTKYALMRYNSTGNVNTDKFQNQKIADFYMDKRDVKFIWFGDQFSELPIFIENLVQKVTEKQADETLQSGELNRNLSDLDEQALLSSINLGVKAQDYYLVDSIFKQTNEADKLLRVVNIAIQSDLINKKAVTQAFNFPNFWDALNKVFEHLTQDSKDKIFSVIAKVQGWNQNVLLSMVDICLSAAQKSNLGPGERARFLSKQLGTILKSDYLDEVLVDSQLRCLWLIEQLRQRRSTNELVTGDAKFDFDISTYRRFLNVLNGLSKANYLSEFKWLKEFTVVGLLYALIKKEKLRYKGGEVFPPTFYQNLIVQRILINIDLVDGLPDEVLTALLNGIDFKQQFLGAEMNKFVSKHPNKKAEKPGYYIDGIISGAGGWVKEKPFLNISAPENAQQVDALITQLANLSKKTEMDKYEPLIEYNHGGQNEELLRSLNSDDNWATHADLNNLFLTMILEHPELIMNYRRTITTLLSTGLNKDAIPQFLVMRYVRLASSYEVDIFDGHDNEFLETAVKYFSGDVDSEVYKYLFTEVQPVALVKSHEYELANPGQDSIDLNRFINTSIGNYYLLLETIESDAKNVFNHYHQFFLQALNELDNPLRSYLKGRFFPEISETDSERQNEQAFIGYAHAFKANRPAAEYFADAVAKLLTKEVKDRFLVSHIGMTFAVVLKPSDPRLNQMALNDQSDGVLREVFHFLLNSFIEMDHPERFNLSIWLEWYLKHDAGTLEVVVNVVLHGLNEDALARRAQLVAMIERSVDKVEKKLPEYILYDLTNKANNEPEKLKVIVKLIQELLIKHAIQINAMFVQELKKLISALTEVSLVAEQNDLLENAEQVLPAADYESLLN